MEILLRTFFLETTQLNSHLPLLYWGKAEISKTLKHFEPKLLK